MNTNLESRLAAQLSDALSLLGLLETYSLVGPPGPDGPGAIDEVKVSFRTPWAANGKDASAAMEKAVTTIVAENMEELIKTAVANQRMVVSDARKALLDYQFEAMKPPPVVEPDPLVEGVAANGADPAVVAAEIGEEITF